MLSFYFYIFLQIVTESLPISSSGHMRLAEMGTGILWEQSVQEYARALMPYAPMIMFILHIPTLMLCVIAWGTRWRVHAKALFSSCRMFFDTGIMGFIATVITTFFFALQRSSYALSIPLPVGFFITACALFSMQYNARGEKRVYSTRTDGFVLGIAQGFALLPGVSRFAIVLASALWRGMDPLYALFVTWLLAMPLFVASGLLGVYQLHQAGLLHELITIPWLVVVMVATVAGWYALCMAERALLTKRMGYFGIYLLCVIGVLISL